MSFWIWMQKEKNEWERETVILQREKTAAHPASCAMSVKNTIDPSEKVLKMKNLRVGTCGMRNLGNSCYMNAVIQCLSIVEGFLNSPLDSENIFVSEYEKLITMLREKTRSALSPTHFKRYLGKVDTRFKNNDPQDAHELLLMIIQKLKRGRESCGNSRALERSSLGTLLTSLRCLNCNRRLIHMEEFNCLSLQIHLSDMFLPRETFEVWTRVCGVKN